MYNKSLFNKTLFGRIAVEEPGLYATITSEMNLVPAYIRVDAKMGAVTIAAVSSVVLAKLKLLMPLGPVTMAAVANVSGRLAVHVRMPITTIAAISTFSAPSIRTAETTEMVLNGINLAPGSTLIIDTDTLEIEINGVPNVDCWVTGGTFFQLKEGENRINLYDNVSSRTLVVTALWADRYL